MTNRSRSKRILSALTALALFAGASAAHAQTFTSEEFLKWPKSQQQSYLTISASMAGVITTQLNKTQAKCIDQWYKKEAQNNHRALTETMRKFKTYHPQGVILWMIQRECGAID